jgi:hypothetical protein
MSSRIKTKKRARIEDPWIQRIKQTVARLSSEQ